MDAADHVWEKRAVVAKTTKGATELFGARGHRYARERRDYSVGCCPRKRRGPGVPHVRRQYRGADVKFCAGRFI